MMESHKPKRELSKEETQDAQIGLLEWELEERDKRHADEFGIEEKTGLRTYTYLMEKLENALKVIRMGKANGIERADLHAVSLIGIDIDNFKQVNDTFGHLAGDEVLQKVAELLKHSVREEDIVARPGGDELMVMLRGPGADVAIRHAGELRAKIEEMTFTASPDLKVTASFGVSTTNGTTEAKALYEQADKALYEAKNAGRNQVKVYREP